MRHDYRKEALLYSNELITPPGLPLSGEEGSGGNLGGNEHPSPDKGRMGGV